MPINSNIVSKILKIKSPKMPPDVDFILIEIRRQGLEPVRWSIIEVNDNELTVSVSGYAV